MFCLSIRTNGSKIDPMQILPDEDSIKILSYLDPKDLGNCRHLNHNWFRNASDPTLWTKFKDPYNVPDDANIISYAQNSVNSMEEVIKRLEDFIKKCPIDSYQRFVCKIPLNRCYKIVVDIALGGKNFMDKVYIIAQQDPDSVFPNLSKFCILNEKLEEDLSGTDEFPPCPLTAGMLKQSFVPAKHLFGIKMKSEEYRSLVYKCSGKLPFWIESSDIQKKLVKFVKKDLMNLRCKKGVKIISRY